LSPSYVAGRRLEEWRRGESNPGRRGAAVNHGPRKRALIPFDYPGSTRQVPSFGHRVPKTSALPHQHGAGGWSVRCTTSAWASTSVPGLLAAGLAAVCLLERGDSNFQRKTSVSSPKAVQVRRVPNGTRRSRDRSRIPKRPARAQLDPRKRNRSRSRPRGMAHRATPPPQRFWGARSDRSGSAPRSLHLLAKEALLAQARGAGRVRPLVLTDTSPGRGSPEPEPERRP